MNEVSHETRPSSKMWEKPTSKPAKMMVTMVINIFLHLFLFHAFGHFCLHLICLCTTYAPCAHVLRRGCQSGPLGLELEAIVKGHVGAGT